MLEPAEEQLDLPALAIGFGDDRGRSGPQIAPEDKAAGVVGIVPKAKGSGRCLWIIRSASRKIAAHAAGSAQGESLS